jgi:hypothetical protein
MNRRIYFYGMFDRPHLSGARGGQQVVSQHASILRDAGRDARIVYRGRWTEALQPFKSPPDPFISDRRFRVEFSPTQDILVVPGRFVNRLKSLPGKHVVLFSQGAAITVRSLGLERHQPDPWRHPKLRAILSVSESNAELLRSMRPTVPVMVIQNSVDPDRFSPTEKRPLVLCSTLTHCEKNPLDATAVVQMLHARRAREEIGEFNVVELRDLPHQEVARLLGQARLLLFLSTHEGLGLLALEAMLSETVVLAIDRGPMSEFIPPECRFDFGDLNGLEEAAKSVLESPGRWNPVIRKARQVALRYGPVCQRASVLKAWKHLDAHL